MFPPSRLLRLAVVRERERERAKIAPAKLLPFLKTKLVKAKKDQK